VRRALKDGLFGQGFWARPMRFILDDHGRSDGGRDDRALDTADVDRAVFVSTVAAAWQRRSARIPR
jgi:hypothetical protein